MRHCSTLQYISSTVIEEEKRATAKTSTVTFRIEPELKEALRTAAQQEHRSIANMVAVLIRDHCKQNGIELEKSKGKMINGARG
jgi:hypothetical protein